MLENIKGIIFDLDGSLADSMWVWSAVDDEYIKRYKLQMPEDFYEAIEGKSFTETAQYFLDMFPQLDMTLEELKQEWVMMAEEKYRLEVPLKEGVREFLKDMKEQRIPVGIATSNHRSLAEELLEANHIREYIDVIWTSCDVKTGKPAPDVYLRVAESLGISPESCLVFEDVPMGILAGKNAGMKVCAVEDSFSRHQEARKKELADYYIRNYNDIKNKTYEVL